MVSYSNYVTNIRKQNDRQALKFLETSELVFTSTNSSLPKVFDVVLAVSPITIWVIARIDTKR